MKTTVIKCPACDAPIKVDIRGKESVFCCYCGHQIHLDTGKQEYVINQNITITKTTHKRYTDDAKVIKEINKGKENRFIWGYMIVVLIVGLSLMSIPYIMLAKFDVEEKNAISEGKISAGYYRDLVGEDYQTVEAHFRAAGFTNIELIDLDDSNIAFWKDGKVKTISVGGNTSFESTDWFYSDTIVVISYH